MANKPMIQRWVKALRSGRYAQGKGQLLTTNHIDRFCCLGVACDLFQPKGYFEQVRHASGDNLWYFFDQGDPPETGNWSTLPKSLQNELGLDDGTVCNLQNFNDEGKTFRWIANWLERKYLK